MKPTKPEGVRWPHSYPHRLAALSLLDTLVAMALALLLLGLLLPAVQRTRHAAHAMLCQSRLRTVVRAVHAYHEVFRMFPGYIRVGVPEHSMYSIHSSLLPYLDESGIAEWINFELPLRQPHHSSMQQFAPHETAANTRVRTFVCPADPHQEQFPGAVNYRGNWGVGPHWGRSREYPDSANGFFGKMHGFRLTFRDIYDGMAYTSAFSERTVGNAMPDDYDPARTILIAPGNASLYCRNADDCAAYCFALSQFREAAGVYPFAGKYWLVTGVHQTLYNHILGPNSNTYDCQLFSYNPPIMAGSARSAHTGGVHVAFGDGHVRWIADDISIRVWRAMGSRDGGEVITF